VQALGRAVSVPDCTLSAKEAPEGRAAASVPKYRVARAVRDRGLFPGLALSQGALTRPASTSHAAKRFSISALAEVASSALPLESSM
jgi:hypothetical protein